MFSVSLGKNSTFHYPDEVFGVVNSIVIDGNANPKGLGLLIDWDLRHNANAPKPSQGTLSNTIHNRVLAPRKPYSWLRNMWT